MTVADGEVIRASARWSGYHQQDLVNVYHFRTDFATAQDEQDVFDAVDTYLQSVYALMDGLMSSGVYVNDLKVDVVQYIAAKWKVTQNVSFGPWGSTLATAAGDDVLPAGDAMVGFLYTSLGKHQGRKFFGGFTETSNTASGAVNSGLQTICISALTLLLTPYTISAGNDLITVVPGVYDGVVRDVISVGVNGHWGYQRNRKPGVGS